MNEIVANDKLGAFCRHTHVEMRGADAGPLAGLTFAAKDLYDVAGQKTGFGNPDWLRTHEPAARTAPVTCRSRSPTNSCTCCPTAGSTAKSPAT